MAAMKSFTKSFSALLEKKAISAQQMSAMAISLAKNKRIKKSELATLRQENFGGSGEVATDESLDDMVREYASLTYSSRLARKSCLHATCEQTTDDEPAVLECGSAERDTSTSEHVDESKGCPDSGCGSVCGSVKHCPALAKQCELEGTSTNEHFDERPDNLVLNGDRPPCAPLGLQVKFQSLFCRRVKEFQHLAQALSPSCSRWLQRCAKILRESAKWRLTGRSGIC